MKREGGLKMNQFSDLDFWVGGKVIKGNKEQIRRPVWIKEVELARIRKVSFGHSEFGAFVGLHVKVLNK